MVPFVRTVLPHRRQERRRAASAEPGTAPRLSMMPSDPKRQPPLGAAEFDELYHRLKAKAIWGQPTGVARSTTSHQRT